MLNIKCDICKGEIGKISEIYTLNDVITQQQKYPNIKEICHDCINEIRGKKRILESKIESEGEKIIVDWMVANRKADNHNHFIRHFNNNQELMGVKDEEIDFNLHRAIEGVNEEFEKARTTKNTENENKVMQRKTTNVGDHELPF